MDTEIDIIGILPLFVQFLQFSVFFLQLIKRVKRSNHDTKRRWWVRPHNSQASHDTFSGFRLFLYFLRNDHEEFFKFTRMTPDQFMFLHELVKSNLEKKSKRKPLSAMMRLAITLSFLARDHGITAVGWFYRVGRSTIYEIIPQVCKVIWETLQPRYLKTPSTEQDWIAIPQDFESLRDYPNCIGALDGKHVKIWAPGNSGRAYHNYEGTFSFVLMAACDVHYRFLWVDIGDYGTWRESPAGKAFNEGLIRLPSPKNLPSTTTPIPFHLVGDEGFPLKTYFMHPYSRLNLGDMKKRIFNYRLSRARRIIENVFGILAMRWAVLQNAMRFQVENVKTILQATIALHNFIISTELEEHGYQRNYVDPWTLDRELDCYKI